jgi:diketogulonate reductase-like aldo/keto reductase
MHRRRFITTSGALIAGSYLAPAMVGQQTNSLLHRTIPASGETIPVVGMGSWLTFDVGRSSEGRKKMGQVLKAFAQHGGKVIDSSPMYGSSEEVIGDLARSLGIVDKLWIATKVWTNGKQQGVNQIQNSNKYFSNLVTLNQIHNLRDLQEHYYTLRELKEAGKLKYIGLTHYTNYQHKALAIALKKYKVDFIQVNYNIENPHAEEQLLPTAADHGVAVLINRPYQTGSLFRMVNGKPLPGWVKEQGVNSWATYFLKYIISNPQVTCTIPATTQVQHVIENLASATGWIPNSTEREQMRSYFQSIM